MLLIILNLDGINSIKIKKSNDLIQYKKIKPYIKNNKLRHLIVYK